MNWDFRGVEMANCPSLLAATPFLQGWENVCLSASICNYFLCESLQLSLGQQKEVTVKSLSKTALGSGPCYSDYS